MITQSEGARLSSSPAFTALSPFLQVYRFGRHLIPAPLRRPIMNLLPSRRVKALLRIVDTMHENAVRIYTEKKALAKTGEKTHEGDEKVKDLCSLLRMWNFIVPGVACL